MRLRRIGPGRYRAAATLRYLARGKTVVLACYRERTPDPYGRASPLDPRCGDRRLRLPAPAPARAATAVEPRALPRAPRLATERFTAG